MSRLAQLFSIVVGALLGTQLAHAERTTTYLHTDSLGSVVAASDQNGALLWRKEYRPFGEQLDSTSEHEKIAYTGKEHDDVSRLTYFGARYYDPEIGRFLSIDPAGVDPAKPLSFNRYAYANNNPYRFIDPDGWQSQESSCDEPCQYDLERKRATRGAAIFREGSSELADAVDKEATNAWNWVPFIGGLKKGERAARGLTAGARVNMPAWKKIVVDMEEVASGHMVGGRRLAPGNMKDVFPESMTSKQVERAIRHAYRHGEVLHSQGTDRVFVRGPFGSGSIEMWVNKKSKAIETAWPKF